LRTIAAVTALAVREVVDAAELSRWGSEASDALAAALSATGLTAAGPYGGLFHGDFFELERSEVTAFVPVAADAAPAAGLDSAGSVRLLRIPAVEAAVAVHEGAFSEIDRAYAAVGEVVAERAIGVDGPDPRVLPGQFGRHRRRGQAQDRGLLAGVRHRRRRMIRKLTAGSCAAARWSSRGPGSTEEISNGYTADLG
jgi:effector-binding domain-containing protein